MHIDTLDTHMLLCAGDRCQVTYFPYIFICVYTLSYVSMNIHECLNKTSNIWKRHIHVHISILELTHQKMLIQIRSRRIGGGGGERGGNDGDLISFGGEENEDDDGEEEEAVGDADKEDSGPDEEGNAVEDEDGGVENGKEEEEEEEGDEGLRKKRRV